MDTLLSQERRLRTAPFTSVGDLENAPDGVDVVVLPTDPGRKYTAGFAVSRAAIEAVLRLRYLVFNVELGEGLPGAAICGLDEDPFDGQMTHLVILDNAVNTIVGTYRIQSARQARQGLGFYSAQEFDLAPLEFYADEILELGRACLAKEHRSMDALLTLWQGMGHFMKQYGLHYVMGCCSITSTDPDDGWRAMKTLRANNYLHPDLLLPARPGYRCGSIARMDAPDLGPALKLPKLFRIYLLLSARILSEPAIDREFGTVDFLTFMDGREIKLSQLDISK